MLLNSCGDGQEVQEDPERLGYSVFTHFLLEGMRGKAADEEVGFTIAAGGLCWPGDDEMGARQIQRLPVAGAGRPLSTARS